MDLRGPGASTLKSATAMSGPGGGSGHLPERDSGETVAGRLSFGSPRWDRGRRSPVHLRGPVGTRGLRRSSVLPTFGPDRQVVGGSGGLRRPLGSRQEGVRGRSRKHRRGTDAPSTPSEVQSRYRSDVTMTLFECTDSGTRETRHSVCRLRVVGPRDVVYTSTAMRPGHHWPQGL